MSFNIALVEPEIPQNTGNIARTCAATGSRLHIVKPMGFEIDNAKLKRAGLDYWHLLSITYYDDLDDFLTKTQGCRRWMVSTKGNRAHSDVEYNEDDYLMFGKETRGLPEDLLFENMDQVVRIPMAKGARSLNLANSVAIVVYEALRQRGYRDICGPSS